MDGVTVVLAQKEHLAEIAALERICFSEPWSEESLALLVGDSAFGTVALCDGQVVAYGGMLTVLDEGQITNIAVLPAFRRKGIGRAVLLAMTEEAKRRGLCMLSLEVRVSNAGAIALYESCGWKRAGERKNFYRHPTESAVVMLRELSE